MTTRLIHGDITHVDTDAIVNAANSHLAPGGGVCGAIHLAAGPQLALACAQYVAAHGAVPTGSAAMTPGFALPALWVVHAVGPVWHGGDSGEADLLASAYRSAVLIADEAALRSIAFPSISTGIFGFPVELAAPVALAAVSDAIAEAASVREATFVLYDRATFSAYERALAEL
jgi:O-acetyl-ADP-ribose deacetylase